MGNNLTCCNTKLNEQPLEATNLVDYSNTKQDEEGEVKSQIITAR
jgi:hypothetical protein